MQAVVPQPRVEVVEAQARQTQMRVVEDNGPLAYLFDTARFEQLQRIATLMANESFTPAHLKVNGDKTATVANCFRVSAQALRWGFDPFAVADETYVVHNRLGFQGKLVAAVVNARAGLAGRLSYKHSGTGQDRMVTVSGTFAGETEPRTIELSVKQAATDNKMWKSDPDQKLVYSGVIKWARRHCPEVIMGVLTDDDVDRLSAGDSQPAIPPDGRVNLRGRPAALPPPIEVNGNGAHAEPDVPVVVEAAEPEQQPDAPAPANPTPPAAEVAAKRISKAQLARLAKAHHEMGEEFDVILEGYSVAKVEELTMEQADQIITRLAGMKG